MAITLNEIKKLIGCEEMLLTQGDLVAVVVLTGMIFDTCCMVKIIKIYTKDPEDSNVEGGLIQAFYKNLEIIKRS